MTDTEAIELLAACKPLVENLTAAFPSGIPLNFSLSSQDLEALRGFDRVQNDPIAAGPGLLGKLEKAAGLTQVEVYKLDQLRRLVFKRRYAGRNAGTGLKPRSQ